MAAGEGVTAASFEALSVHMGVGINKARAGGATVQIDYPCVPAAIQSLLLSRQ